MPVEGADDGELIAKQVSIFSSKVGGLGRINGLWEDCKKEFQGNVARPARVRSVFDKISSFCEIELSFSDDEILIPDNNTLFSREQLEQLFLIRISFLQMMALNPNMSPDDNATDWSSLEDEIFYCTRYGQVQIEAAMSEWLDRVLSLEKSSNKYPNDRNRIFFASDPSTGSSGTSEMKASDQILNRVVEQSKAGVLASFKFLLTLVNQPRVLLNTIRNDIQKGISTFESGNKVGIYHDNAKIIKKKYKGQGSKSFKNVIDHTHVQTRKMPHKCERCGKTFSQRSHLVVHARAHQQEQLHNYPYCGSNFSKKGNLDAHILIHMNKKPHKCEHCFTTFRRKAHLTDHLLTHSGLKPYNCAFCQLPFARKRDLRAHCKTQKHAKNGIKAIQQVDKEQNDTLIFGDSFLGFSQNISAGTLKAP